MKDERITFKVPEAINDRFRAFARSKGRTQNGILKQWIKRPDVPQISFPFSRKIDLSDYVDQRWVKKSFRIKPSIYSKFTAYCADRDVDMKDVLLSRMIRIMEKKKLPPIQ